KGAPLGRTEQCHAKTDNDKDQERDLIHGTTDQKRTFRRNEIVIGGSRGKQNAQCSRSKTSIPCTEEDGREKGDKGHGVSAKDRSQRLTKQDGCNRRDNGGAIDERPGSPHLRITLHDGAEADGNEEEQNQGSGNGGQQRNPSSSLPI